MSSFMNNPLGLPEDNPSLEARVLSRGFDRRCFKGGGGSGGNSGGNDNLWNAQSDQVRQSMAMSGELFDYWQKYAPGYLANTSSMVQESQDGTLANRMRAQAGADANASLGAGLAAANRNMERYGAEFNPTKTWQIQRDAGITGALARTDALNKAGQWAENQRWARNQDALGQVSGMPGNATQMLSSANAGMSNLAGMQNANNSMAAQNAAGYGQMGASLAYGLFKADGGQIKLKDGGHAAVARQGLRLANGGAANNPVQGWRARMASMPSLSMARSNNGSPIGQFLAGAAPVAAAQLAKPAATALWEAGKSALLGQAAGNGITGSIAPALANAGTTAATGAGMSGALGSGISGGLASAGGTAAAEAGAGALGSGVTGSIAPALASAGEAGAAATAAGAANAWNPLGWGLLAAGALTALSDAFADGGQAKTRKDVTRGGKVTGKGTPTSDSIPVWMSDKEYAINADAVKSVGLKTLDAINEIGLKKRYGEQARMIDGKAYPNGVDAHESGNKLALGGNLGIAMGAAANEWNRQREQDRQDAANRRADESLKLQQAADARAQESHGLKMAADKITLEDTKRANEMMAKIRADLDLIRSGDYTPLKALGADYNNQIGAFNDGNTLTFDDLPEGGIRANQFDKAGKALGSLVINSPQAAASAYLDAAGMQLATLSPAFFQARMQAQAKAKESAADRALQEKLGVMKDGTQRYIAEMNNQNALRVAGIHAGAASAGNALQRERFDFERGLRQAEADRKQAEFAQRARLADALERGDAQEIERESRRAAAYGISTKGDQSSPLEYATTFDPDGSRALMTNKKTGELYIINANTGQVNPISTAAAKGATVQTPGKLPTKYQR